MVSWGFTFFCLVNRNSFSNIEESIKKKAQENAKVQSHLVESISGIETLKSQNIELRSELKWEQLYGDKLKQVFKIH